MTLFSAVICNGRRKQTYGIRSHVLKTGINVVLLSLCDRSRKFYIQRNGQARNQYGKGIGRNEIEPEIPKDVSKLRMIMRPLGFTIMV